MTRTTIKTKENIGYAGSQKLAYYLAIQDDFPDYVIMLHGDGQYDPSLLSIIAPYVDKGFAIVNGFRDKKSFPKKKQDLRIDLPTVGFKTFLQCKSAGLKGIVLKSNRNVFLDKKKCIAFANKNKMFVTVK